jgi:hypothetical protein
MKLNVMWAVATAAVLGAVLGDKNDTTATDTKKNEGQNGTGNSLRAIIDVK